MSLGEPATNKRNAEAKSDKGKLTWGDLYFRSIFSYGPRSCVGRNVAMMELFCFISTLVSRHSP